MTSVALSLSGYDPLTIELLPERAQRDFKYWRSLIEPVLAQRHGVRPMLKQIAVSSGQPWKTVRNRYYRARKGGLLALVDRRLCGPVAWATSAPVKISPVSQSRGLQELWKMLCESNQRKSRPEFNTLVRMWKERDARIGAIAEYRDFPGWPKLPPGWTYTNLMRYGPDSFELAAARQGRFAAAAHRSTVFTTRKGLWVGSHYLFDDKWHDFFVNTLAERQHGRPLEVYSMDLFSARKLRWGVRVRTRDEQGNYRGIGEIMMRYVLAATLYVDGYSARGTTLVAEKGTAAVSGAIADRLKEISGGAIVLHEGGMTGDPAHIGQYPGIVRGNPRHKAALESNNNLEHNHFGSLPGQTGNCVENRPEELHGRLDYNALLLAAYDQLPPEKAALLEFPILELNQFMDVAGEIYARIAHLRNHELEGWIESGNVLQAFDFGGQLVTELQLSPEQRAALPALLEGGFLKTHPLRMSRQEVWDRGKDNLVKLPGWGVVAILGDDLAREARVVDHTITIRDDEVGPGKFYFEPFVRTVTGATDALRDGEAYDVFINPFAPDMLFVRDAKKRYLGEAQRIFVPSHADEEGIRRAIGAAAKRESALLAPLRARHLAEARAKLARHEANARAVGGPAPARGAKTATDILEMLPE